MFVLGSFKLRSKIFHLYTTSALRTEFLSYQYKNERIFNGGHGGRDSSLVYFKERAHYINMV